MTHGAYWSTGQIADECQVTIDYAPSGHTKLWTDSLTEWGQEGGARMRRKGKVDKSILHQSILQPEFPTTPILLGRLERLGLRVVGDIFDSLTERLACLVGKDKALSSLRTQYGHVRIPSSPLRLSVSQCWNTKLVKGQWKTVEFLGHTVVGCVYDSGTTLFHVGGIRLKCQTRYK